MLEAISNVILTLCAMAGAFVAAIGLQTWRSQLRGTTEFDLARRLLLSTLRYRQAMRAARSPITQYTRQTGKEGEAHPGSVPTEARIADLNSRWRLIADARSELDSVLLEAEATWDNLDPQPFVELEEAENDLYYAFLVISELADESTAEFVSKDDKLQSQRVAYGNGTRDPITPRVNGAVDAIMAELRVCMRPPLLSGPLVRIRRAARN